MRHNADPFLFTWCFSCQDKEVITLLKKFLEIWRIVDLLRQSGITIERLRQIIVCYRVAQMVAASKKSDYEKIITMQEVMVHLYDGMFEV